MRHYKRDRTSGVDHLKMASGYEKLLEDFESFEQDLEVTEILKKVKVELVLDSGVIEFGEQLAQRERLKQAAHTARATRASYVRQLCYPQHTCPWFIEGLDFCCPYWRYEFKRPLTPPPVPPPSPDACQRTDLPLHLPPHETPHHDQPTKRRRRHRR